MTASPQRRRRITMFGALSGLVVVVVVVVVGLVASSTLRSSNEGRAPETDDRDLVSFPTTPNAALAVVDDLDRLTSIAVVTLDPSGVGGSIAVVPVNADQTNGFGSTRLPISRQPYTPGDVDQEAQLLFELEPLLTLTIERAAVVGPDELDDLLDRLDDTARAGRGFEVDLPEQVVDSDTVGSGFVASEGEQVLDVDEMVRAFTAINARGPSFSHHDVDVALWRGVAAAAGDGAVDVDIDEVGRPVAPADVDELWDRLLAGEVTARPLAIDVNAARFAENESEADFVVVDRRDALMVFGSVSPGLVSKPNESVNVSLVVGFDDDDVASLGDTSVGFPISKASMTRRFIGELLFAQANIVSVDLADEPDDVPDVTRIEIADPELEDDVRNLTERFFGDAEVVVSDVITDGVDAVVVLGDDFLVQRRELLEIERRQAEQDAAEADAENAEDGIGAEPAVGRERSDDDETVSTDTVVDDE